MLKSYIMTRITQPTTWLGLSAAGAALVASGGKFDGNVASALLAAFGLVHVNEEGASK